MGAKLFIDDIRECPEGWVAARNISSAIALLSMLNVDEVSLDHDIACSHPGCYSDCELESFMSVARYIKLMNPRPAVIRIHTGNIQAGYKMAALLGLSDYQGAIFDYRNYRKDSTFSNEGTKSPSLSKAESAEGGALHA